MLPISQVSIISHTILSCVSLSLSFFHSFSRSFESSYAFFASSFFVWFAFTSVYILLWFLFFLNKFTFIFLPFSFVHLHSSIPFFFFWFVLLYIPFILSFSISTSTFCPSIFSSLSPSPLFFYFPSFLST